MKLLITAGGTSEKIDDVRSITNHSSGNTGKTLADYFKSQGHSVTYVTTKDALQPENVDEKYFISSTADLEKTLKKLLQQPFDGVIHAMAVSDFTLENGFSKEEYLQLAKENTSIFNVPENLQKGKISSKTDNLILLLKKTPKIISQIKKWQPTTHLIGFKLLTQVPKEELLAVAFDSLQKNQADLIVANDLTEVTKDSHHAYLVGQNTTQEVFTNLEMAQEIERYLEEK